MIHQLLFQRISAYIVKLLFVIWAFIAFMPAFSQNWSYATLEEKKVAMMAAVNGNKIYFYSGMKMVGSSQTRVSQLEIFDVTTGTKEVINLAPEQIRVSGATAVWGGNIFFGGGVLIPV
jgi:hypothetical protein